MAADDGWREVEIVHSPPSRPLRKMWLPEEVAESSAAIDARRCVQASAGGIAVGCGVELGRGGGWQVEVSRVVSFRGFWPPIGAPAGSGSGSGSGTAGTKHVHAMQ